MSHSAADNRRVFLAYRTLFTGPEAQIRKSTKVRKIVTKHQGSFHPLIRDLGLPKIVEIVKILLDQQVFESELKAKIVFPELFQTSPERNVQRNASEKEATRSIAEAIEEAVLVLLLLLLLLLLPILLLLLLLMVMVMTCPKAGLPSDSSTLTLASPDS